MNHSEIISTSILRCTKPPSPGIELEVIQTETILNNKKEGWSISVSTHSKDCELLEVSSISVSMPGGKIWRGTIQDFMAIFAVGENAYNCLSAQYHINHNRSVFEAREEVYSVLSHVEPLVVKV